MKIIGIKKRDCQPLSKYLANSSFTATRYTHYNNDHSGNIVRCFVCWSAERKIPKYYLGISNDFLRFTSSFHVSRLNCLQQKSTYENDPPPLQKKSHRGTNCQQHRCFYLGSNHYSNHDHNGRCLHGMNESPLAGYLLIVEEISGCVLQKTCHRPNT